MFKLSMRTIFTPDISPPGVAIRKSTMSSADEREIGDQDGLACPGLLLGGPHLSAVGGRHAPAPPGVRLLLLLFLPFYRVFHITGH